MTSPSVSLRKNLRSICADGVAFSLMVGFGETYIPAFAMALGMSEVLTGLIATLPIFGGSVMQLASPWGVGRFRSYRVWVLGAVALQVLSLFLLAGIAWYGSAPAGVVFFAATLYWAGGLATSAAWNTWVEFLVPTRIRPTFFARRVRLCQVSLLAGLVLGGLVLRWAQLHEVALPAFAGLFLLAGLCRCASWVALFRQTEKQDWVGVAHNVVARSDRKARIPAVPSDRGKEFGLQQFVVYLCLVQVAVYISGPFFTPYMLKQLGLSYMSYMMLLALGFAGKVFALPFVGEAARRWGAGTVFCIGGLGIVPVAGLWAFHDSFYFLMGVQILSGVCWAFYELAMFLLFLERIPQSRRVLVLSYYNVGNSLAMVCGALLGAGLMELAGGGVLGYMTVFLLSSVGRAATIPLMPVWRSATAKPDATPATRAPEAKMEARGAVARLELGKKLGCVPPTTNAAARGIERMAS